MVREAPRTRRGSAVAALVTAVLLGLPVGALAHPEDRPPAHAGGGEDAPPPHADSDAPEDRPPAHARADRHAASFPEGEGPQAQQRDHSGPGQHHPAPGRRSAPGGNAPAPADRGVSADRPGPGGPAPGLDDGSGTEPDPELGTELDTDVVADGALPPDRDRTQSAAGSPVLPAPPAPVVLAVPVLGTSTVSPFPPAPAAAEDTTTPPSLPGSPGDTDAGPRQPAPDAVAAPAPPARPATVPELTRRVVVPVALLVAALAYLLVQGRIDRRGQLLVAPDASGSEHDEDVYEL